MKEWNLEKIKKTIYECHPGRLLGIQETAKVFFAMGEKEGVVSSGGYHAFWETVNDEPVIQVLMKEGETIEDYLI